jgi:hypothetical protein
MSHIVEMEMVAAEVLGWEIPDWMSGILAGTPS